jgi:hypothetical protein
VTQDAEVPTGTGDPARPTGTLSFVHPLRPNAYDLFAMVAVVALWYAGSVPARFVAVVLALSLIARPLLNLSATTLSPAGISYREGRDRIVLPWEQVGRIEAVEGLTSRYVRVARNGGRPVVLRTPVAQRLGRPDDFQTAVDELQRWATAYGRNLTVAAVRLCPTAAAVVYRVVAFVLVLAPPVIAFLQRSHGGRPNLAVVAPLVVLWVGGFVIGAVERGRA